MSLQVKRELTEAQRQNGEEWCEQAMKDMGNICVEGLVPHRHGAENDTEDVSSPLFIASESLKFKNII